MRKAIKSILAVALCALIVIIGIVAYQFAVVSGYFEGVTEKDMSGAKISPIELKGELVLKNLFVRSFYRDYVNAMDIKGDMRVLDFGAGAGTEAEHLAKRLPGGTLVCLDISPTWLKLAKNRLKDRTNVEYVAGDIRELNIEKESMDAVVIHFVLHDIPAADRDGILKSIARVMKPGAALYIREPVQLKRYKEAHGLSKEAVRKYMLDSGLREKSLTTGSNIFVGEYTYGVFVK